MGGWTDGWTDGWAIRHRYYLQLPNICCRVLQQRQKVSIKAMLFSNECNLNSGLAYHIKKPLGPPPLQERKKFF